MRFSVTFPSPVASATPRRASAWSRLACALFVSALPGVALAQTTAMPAVSSVPAGSSTSTTPTIVKAAVNVSTYKLGPEDVLRVVVENYPAYSQDNVPVLPDGTINLPFYGQLKVSGQTIPQVQVELRRRLSRRFRHTDILTLSIVKPRNPEPVQPDIVYVLGAVEKPGPVRVEKGHRLTQVLAAIGGVKGRLDEVQTTLTRPGKGSTMLDAEMAMMRPSSVSNVTVQNGDTITITVNEPGRVVVGGAVARPGVFEMHRTPRFGNELPLEPRLLDVLVAAGGVKAPPLADTARLAAVPAEVGNVANANGGNAPAANAEAADDEAQFDPERFTGSIIRQNKTISLPIGEVLANKDGKNNPANVPILAGDFVTVEYVPPKPPVILTVVVEGSAVRQPGKYTVPEGTRVVDVIAGAGGLAKPLSETRVSLRRAGSDKLMPIDLQKAFLSSDPNVNPVVKNYDILMVKEPDTVEVLVTGRFSTLR